MNKKFLPLLVAAFLLVAAIVVVGIASIRWTYELAGGMLMIIGITLGFYGLVLWRAFKKHTEAALLVDYGEDVFQFQQEQKMHKVRSDGQKRTQRVSETEE